MTYYESLTEAMSWLGQQENTYFIGQAVEYNGTGMTNTLKHVPSQKKKEMPVFEETQTGIAIGLALAGFVPISIYPRLNFLLAAMNQLINHADKYSLMSDYRPKVIFRSSIGSIVPLNPQEMHTGDYSDAIKLMSKTIKVTKVMHPEEILPAYQDAYYSEYSSLIIEFADYLNEPYRLECMRKQCK